MVTVITKKITENWAIRLFYFYNRSRIEPNFRILHRPLARPLCQSRFVLVRVLLLELVPPLVPLQQRRGDGGHCGGGVGSVRAAVAAQ